jgi:hypothetical protein
MATSMTSPWQEAQPEDPSDPPDDPGRRRGARRWGPPLLCIGIYTVLAAFVYGAHSPVSSTLLPPCACGDIPPQTWMLAWPAHALSSGQNPFFSTSVAYPGGINLMSNTAAPLLGIIFAPVTWSLGPVAAYNLVMRLAFALSATSMALVLRRWTTWWPAAFAGGLLYAFCPFMVEQALAHDFLIFVPLPPLILALLDEILVRRQRPVRNGILLGVVLTAQLLISPEVLEMTGLLAVFGVIVVVLLHPRAFGAWLRDAGAAGRGLLAAAVSGAVLSAYPLWVYFAGPYHIKGAPHPVSLLSAYHSSVDGLIYPTPFERLHLGHWLARGLAITQGGGSEYTTYVGVPLLLLLAVILVRFRRSGPVVVFTLVAFAAWIVTLGRHLYLGTVEHSSIRLPYYVLEKVPLINGALDLRYSLIMYLAIAVVLALGLDHFRRDGIIGSNRRPWARFTRGRWTERRRGGVTALVAIIALVPLIPALPYTSTPAGVPTVFTAKDSPIADGDVVLCLPLPVGYLGFNDQALLWQAVANMRFTLIGFRGAVPGPDHKPIRDAQLLLPPIQVEQLLSWGVYGLPTPPPPLDETTLTEIRSFLGRYDVGSVVIVPSGGDWQAVVPYFTDALQFAPVDFDGSYVWPHIQSDLKAAP